MKHSISYMQIAVVDLKEDAFTDEFMEDFRDYMYPFETIGDHAEHIGQLAIRGILSDGEPDEFIEGYGNASDFVNRITLLPADIQTNT